MTSVTLDFNTPPNTTGGWFCDRCKSWIVYNTGPHICPKDPLVMIGQLVQSTTALRLRIEELECKVENLDKSHRRTLERFNAHEGKQ